MKKLTKKQEEKFELINCVSWICLDASWMFGVKILAYLFIAPTILSAIVLILGIKVIPLKILNTGVMTWSLMNIFWMCSEFLESRTLLYLAFGCFAVGTFMILFVVSLNPEIKKGFMRRIGTLRRLARY